MPEITYTPPGSLMGFFTSQKFVDLVVGPFGCVSCDTEFLTPTGWKRIDQYKEGDLVAQWDSLTEQAEFVKPLSYIKLPCDKFYHFHHREGLSQALSEEHRMVYKLRHKKPVWHERTAKEIAEWHWRNGADMVRIPVTFKAPKTPGMPYTDDELRLAIAICADGTICHTGAVAVNLKKRYKKDRIVELLKRLGIEYSVHKSAPGYDRYYFRHKIQDKEFGPSWWAANEHQLGVIADELPRWDGGTTAKGLSIYRSTNKASVDFAQYCFVVAGKKTSLNIGKGGCWQVLASNRGAQYVGVAGVRKGTHEGSNNCDIVPSPDGCKYCFSVPSSYLILRHNNCVFVTGNSTKTTAGLMKIAYQAKLMAPCDKDGIRRSRCVWVRNTREQLRDTSIKDFLEWFPDGVAGEFKKTENSFLMKFDDVECEVLFRGLDDSKDVRRLLSLQLSFAVMDEFREINADIFKSLQGRLGRYPDKKMVLPRPQWGKDDKGNEIGGCVKEDGSNNAMMWGQSNPPDMGTFWEEYLSDPPPVASVFFQPSGRSPEADWLKYLPNGYYDTLCEGHDEDWISIYVDAKFGKSLSGQPVFKTFNRTTHVAKGPLMAIDSNRCPLVLGMDLALHPACVVAQVDYKGRLLVLDETYATGMGVYNFLQEKVKPLLASRFPGRACFVVCDPAGNTRAQTDERTALDVIRAAGFQVIMASTNAIQARLSAVETFLNRMSDGEPGFLIDPRCTTLINAMAGKYRYRKKNDDEVADTPEKSHPWSDIADALQYVCLHSDVSGVFTHKKRSVLPVQRVNWAYV